MGQNFFIVSLQMRLRLHEMHEMHIHCASATWQSNAMYRHTNFATASDAVGRKGSRESLLPFPVQPTL